MLIGLDWDGEALERAAQRLAQFDGKFRLLQRSYTELGAVLSELGFPRVNGILLDLGVSTLQLTDPSRGFSFRQDERLVRAGSPPETDAAGGKQYPASSLAVDLPLRRREVGRRIAARWRLTAQEGPIRAARSG